MGTAKTVKNKAIISLLVGILIVFFTAVFYINLSITPSFYCSDMYSDMMLAVEIWEQKTMFPDGWVYGNQLYTVSTPIVAALFYGLGILFAASFCWMIKPVLKREASLFALVFLMALVAFFGDAYEKTNGWQLFFTMCTYYACYGITAFLAFGCYIRCKLYWNTKLSVILAITCVLSFGTGIQSLRQTAVMCLPLLLVEGLNVANHLIRKERFLDTSLFVTLMVMISNVSGVVFKNFLSVPQVEIFGQTALASPTQWFVNLEESIVNIATLFIRAEEFPLYVGASIVALYVIITMYLLMKSIRRNDTVEANLLFLLASSVGCIFAIDIMLTMSVRPLYYFMILPLMSIATARIFSTKKYEFAMLILLAGLSIAACYMEVVPACEKAYHKENQIYYEVSDYLVENGYETIYTRWNRGEKIAIASGGVLEAGFWTEPFAGVAYICNPGVFYRDNDTAVYCFDSKTNAEQAIAIAERHDITLELLKYFEEADIYLYKTPVNLMALYTTEHGLVVKE